MTSGQALLVKLAKLVKELLQKLPYWWKLPIVLMMFYQIRQRDYLLNNNLFDAYSSQLTGPKYDCQDPLMGKYYYEVGWGAGDGAVVRPLASHQCSLGFKSQCRRHMWVELVVGSLLCSKRFFSGYSGFLSSKTNISKFQFDQELGRRRTTLWMCYLQIIFYYLFIYLNEKILIHIITYPPTICLRDGRKKTVETWLSIRERKAGSGSSKGGIPKKDQMKDAGE